MDKINNEEYLLRYIETLEQKVRFLETEVLRLKGDLDKPNVYDYNFWHESQRVSSTAPVIEVKPDNNE